MKTTAQNVIAGFAGAAIAFTAYVTFMPKAEAAAVYHDGNKTTVYRGGYYGAPVAPHKTTVKHNDKNDTVKVCREYVFGTKSCAKWSY